MKVSIRKQAGPGGGKQGIPGGGTVPISTLKPGDGLLDPQNNNKFAILSGDPPSDPQSVKLWDVESGLSYERTKDQFMVIPEPTAHVAV